ncbi:MAG: aldo/keto reductase [Patescibacteria group bacterium]|jgi:2,5-diketo-D-gluconate reductase B
MDKSPEITIEKDINMPVLGFGTAGLLGSVCQNSVTYALELGYRHIDTAKDYNNQEDIRFAIKNSGVKREDIFITSKVPGRFLGRDTVFTDCEETLEELGTGYLDLYLIHWPNPQIPIKETLIAMQELKEKGMVKTIGVSNFTIPDIQEVLEIGRTKKIKIADNQIRVHPSYQNTELVGFCQKNNISVTAYSPLGKGSDLNLPVIEKLAEKYGRPASQVIINWILAKGMITIPRSSERIHIKENWEALEWKLEDGDVAKVDKLGYW